MFSSASCSPMSTVIWIGLTLIAPMSGCNPICVPVVNDVLLACCALPPITPVICKKCIVRHKIITKVVAIPTRFHACLFIFDMYSEYPEPGLLLCAFFCFSFCSFSKIALSKLSTHALLSMTKTLHISLIRK